MFSTFRNREIRRGDNGWFGWYKKELYPTSDPPPQYFAGDMFPQGPYGFLGDEKPIAQVQYSDMFYSTLVISKVPIPQTTTTPILAASQPQDTARQAPVESPAPFDVSQTPAATHPVAQPTTQTLYTITSTHNPNNTSNTSNTSNNYNTYNTDPNFFSQNVSNSYDPIQNQGGRWSGLSSLSSGFGDAQIIIPESTPTPPAARASQQSSGSPRKFSWATSIFQIRRLGDRNTIYTTTSEESAPRFRTVNSWVAQQTRHMERQQQIDREVPNMPETPLPVQTIVGNHRSTSESLA
jgi:hypothetical protein